MSVELPAIWGNQQTALASVPEDILHPNDYQRVLDTLFRLSNGAYWQDIDPKTHFTSAEMTILSAKSPVIRDLFKVARLLRDEVRQELREDAMDRRAIEGVAEEQFSAKGEFCGTRQKYSDSLLVTALKAGNPRRFTDVKVGFTGGVTLNVSLGLEREPKAIEGEVVEDEPKAEA